MTDYTKTTNFTVKDTLVSGNPAKIIRGSEFDTEFNNIQVSVATKANIASPSFTGDVTTVDGDFVGNLIGNVTGNVVGNVTGDLTGNVTGNVVGNVTGTASNADQLDNLDSTQFLRSDVSATFTNLTGSTLTSNIVTDNVDGTGNLVFERSGSEKMRLTSDGKLLIGTTSSGVNQATARVLSLDAESPFVAPAIECSGGKGNSFGDFNGGVLLISNSNGNGRAGSITLDNGDDYSAAIAFGSNATTRCHAMITSDNRNLTFGRGDLTFRTKGTTDDAQPTERMRLTNTGYLKVDLTGNYIDALGIGRLSSADHFIHSNQNTAALLVSNSNTNSATRVIDTFLPTNVNSNGKHLRASTGSTEVFSVKANGDISTLGNVSDIKRKENITDATPKLGDINKVRFVNYFYKDGPRAGNKEFGVIAQELEEIFPALVDSTPDTEEVEVTSTDSEGNEVITVETRETGEVTKSVKYSVLTLMAVKALQEADAKIEAQKALLDSQQSTIESLLSRVEALEAK